MEILACMLRSSARVKQVFMHVLELGRKGLSGLLVLMEGDKMASDHKLISQDMKKFLLILCAQNLPSFLYNRSSKKDRWSETITQRSRKDHA